METKAPLVTIYIPCRNYGQYLAQAIKSVIDQIYSNWELIIIDEASSDNSLLVAEEFQKVLPTKITVIKNKKPLGLQKLANLVLGRVMGSI